jgi:hypothetical protein
MGIRVIGFLALVALCCNGCLQTNMTEPQRSAAEQLLLSTVADRAAQTVSLNSFANKKVYFSTNYFEGYDAKYAFGTVRDAFSRAGALLVNDENDAEIVVEARNGALSIDRADSLLGIPSTAVPVGFAGAISIPEIALYKSNKQYSLAKFALLAYSKDSGKHYFSSGPMIGRAHLYYYKFLGFISYTSTDVPEKKKPKKTEAQSQSP